MQGFLVFHWTVSGKMVCAGAEIAGCCSRITVGGIVAKGGAFRADRDVETIVYVTHTNTDLYSGVVVDNG